MIAVKLLPSTWLKCWKHDGSRRRESCFIKQMFDGPHVSIDVGRATEVSTTHSIQRQGSMCAIIVLARLCVQCRPKDSRRWHNMGSKSRGAWLHDQIRVDDQHCVDIRKCRVG